MKLDGERKRGHWTMKAEWLQEIEQQIATMTDLEEHLRLQVDLFGIKIFDLKLLKWANERIFDQADAWIDELLQYTRRMPKLRRMLQANKEEPEAFLRKQIAFLFNGRIDDRFLDNCQQVAVICYRYKIRPSYYNACLHGLEQKLCDMIREKLTDKMLVEKIFASLNKLVSLEQQVMLIAFEKMGKFNQKKKERSMRFKAYHEPLTGLPNSRMAQDTIDLTVTRCAAMKRSFSVYKLNIYRLKMLNQTFDRKCGDFFLQSFASRIREVTKLRDAMLCRINSDEFLIICQDAMNFGEQKEFAEQLIQTSDKPYVINGKKIYGSFNIGIAVYPSHGGSSSQLLLHADAALNEAKKKGRNKYYFYSEALHRQIVQKMMVESELQNALLNQQFILFFQPQMRSSDQKLIGVEALVRWAHPEKGVIPPGGFIAIAEESGLIRDIGQWVLQTACCQMKRWQENGGPKIPISVNLSMNQFHDEDLLKNITTALDVSGLDPRYLDLEITESTMAKDIERSKNMLNEIRKMGISVSLDDFGTGYSSLSYLKNLPINRLKIDRSFVSDIDHNVRDRAIVAAIVAMAEHLWIDVLAEGIETSAQLRAVADCRCDAIQGYLYSKPVGGNDFEASFLRKGRH
ncbi:EAL domain-containing protein [Sporolactobacillus spathodeae]|uniref:Diguanylate cyclase DosC n=1 Tax=Sporolactobacillus spathodeae TaxID=1465502 RepID=A0ABS2Q9T4_9BACL|nr:EAL domain-containing protein [Sporolactobacillus spathodeae]MBM7658376.1 diguanylate cyclase (GGDEF)-like protein [Sporolactobacillus spathodeae]